MSFGRWLRGATRIRFDDRTLGNLVKNAGVAAGTVMGGPAGLAVAGLGSAAGQAALPGSNFGDIARAGLSGAATSGALRAGGGLIKGIANRALPSATSVNAVAPTTTAPVAASGANAATSALKSGIQPIAPGAGAPASVIGQGVGIGGRTVTQPGFLSSAARGVGNFAKQNPTAVGMGLQAVGGMATAGSENRMNNAQTALLEQRHELTEEERQRRNAQNRWLNNQPLQLAPSPVAPNPYTSAG